MKIALTGELGAKRQRIARSHNLRLLALLAILMAAAVVFARLARPLPHASLIICLICLILIEGYGIYSIAQHDNQLCREIGFMCPFCGKPLYENRALIWNTLCPKCGKDIQPRPDSEPCPARPS